MENINLNKYGPIISRKESGNEILELINNSLSNNTQIQIDLNKIKSMATFCAKQIFGNLYLKLGSEKFFERIEILNASDDLKTIIKIGIQNAVNEHNND
ncbi:MAG: DUF4325 domain-containing protein [Lutibacter sp.]|uniref:STAS-like domain-containing protein n=1 Tax=Lutibacter sp. TaxID=1925666 RepID=UPI00299DE994|nr:DUF4325 domain-containing protein [Lutibacter sp.]MDX1828632.1 DUF4325 domain-containing protein [Lutibacter sp.]